jgi:hypothetical protein
LIYNLENYLNWETTYYWRVRGISYNNTLLNWSNNYIFTTSSPKFNITINNSNNQESGLNYIIFGSWSNNLKSGIIDKFGHEIWNSGNENILSYGIDNTGNFLGGQKRYDNNMHVTAVEFNLNNEINWMQPFGNPSTHDHIILPNGNYLGFQNKYELGPIPIGDWTPYFQQIGYAGDGETLEYIWVGQKLVEWDKITNEIIWEWDPFEYYSFDEYDHYGGTWQNTLNNSQPYDWLHSNSIYYNSNDSSILVSYRHISKITKINYPSGIIEWEIGLSDNLIGGSPNNICSELQINWQHDVKVLNNNNILLFNNGNLNQSLFNTEELESSVFEFSINGNNCELIWNYYLDNIYYGNGMGSVQKLENGNYFLSTIANGGNSFEISIDKEIIWNSNYDLFWPEGGLYRAYNISSLFIESTSVLINNYETISFGDTIINGIYLSPSKTKLEIEIYNESYYDHNYLIYIDDTENWVSTIHETVFIEKNSTIEYQIDLNFNNYLSNINIQVIPIYHEENKTLLNYICIKQKLMGDINIDGLVNISDILIIINYIIHDTIITEIEFTNADLDESSIINLVDVLDIINLILNLE